MSKFTQQVFKVTLTGYVTADPTSREGYRLDDLELEELFESMMLGFGPHVDIEPMVPASEPKAEPETDEDEEPGTGPDTGSNIKTREWRVRGPWKIGDEMSPKEFIYRGSDYVRHAGLLDLGTHDTETKVVWLTEDEIVQVREATYATRIANGLKTGIPRNRLNGGAEA
tara:strand:- start:3684 stop:4190 length:507 start_codon:yes stop_codon:yes gene_type:complete